MNEMIGIFLVFHLTKKEIAYLNSKSFHNECKDQNYFSFDVADILD